MPQSHRAARAGPPFSVGFPGAWAHVYPSRDVWGQEGRAFPPMAQFPSNHLGPEGGTEVASLEPHWLQLCCWPLGWEGLKRAHSRDVSGWVCPMRFQEEPSTCPRNAGGYTCPPSPPCSLCTGIGRLRKREGHPLGKKEFCSVG